MPVDPPVLPSLLRKALSLALMSPADMARTIASTPPGWSVCSREKVARVASLPVCTRTWDRSAVASGMTSPSGTKPGAVTPLTSGSIKAGSSPSMCPTTVDRLRMSAEGIS